MAKIVEFKNREENDITMYLLKFVLIVLVCIVCFWAGTIYTRMEIIKQISNKAIEENGLTIERVYNKGI